MRKQERWLRTTARATTDPHLAAGLLSCAAEMRLMDQRIRAERQALEDGTAETLLHIANRLGIHNPELATMSDIERTIDALLERDG